MTGTVFDIGYQRYGGAREVERRPTRAIFKDGVRIALGLGRGARAKILPWFFIALLTGLALIMAMVASTMSRMGNPAPAEAMNLEFYGVASIILFVFAALVAPELLCRDRREGVLQLYLVRPLSGSHYIAGRWAAFLVVMLGAAWIPQLLLFFALVMGANDPLLHLRDHWLDLPRILAAGLAMAAFLTSLALLTASFTTRRAYAAVFLVGLFVITTPFTIGLAQEIDGPVGQWISMFSLTNIPLHVNDVIFGQPSNLTDDAPAREIAGTVRVAWYFAWTLGATVLLWWRYRRLTP